MAKFIPAQTFDTSDIASYDLNEQALQEPRDISFQTTAAPLNVPGYSRRRLEDSPTWRRCVQNHDVYRPFERQTLGCSPYWHLDREPPMKPIIATSVFPH